MLEKNTMRYLNPLNSMSLEKKQGCKRQVLFPISAFNFLYIIYEFVSTQLTQISWLNHLLILSSTITDGEKEF